MRKMKDSGVEWIGDIPEEWEVRKVKFCGSLFASGVDKKTIDGEKLYKSVHYMDIYKNSLKFIGNSDNYLIISEKDEKAASATLEEGDVLLTNSSETPEDIGHSAVVIEPLIDTLMGYHLMRFRPYIKINFAFEKYLFGSHLMRTWFSYRAYGMTRYGLSYNDFASANLILPPAEKQDCIADFLDRKCAQIDTIIAKQQAVIEKLKLYKQSVITEGVTKGLDPDAPMKDSGIEWIGKIPAHWMITKMSYLGQTSSGATPLRNKVGDYFTNADICWIRTLDLNDGLVYDSSEKITEIALKNSSCTILPKFTVCVAMYGGAGTIGKCGLIMNPSTTNQAICSIVCNEQTFPLYLLYQLLALKKYWMKFAVGTRKDPNISQEIVANMKMVVPKYHEQKKIADYLNDTCNKINATVLKKQTLINKLTQYKKSLIYEAVTGKLEV